MDYWILRAVKVERIERAAGTKWIKELFGISVVRIVKKVGCEMSPAKEGKPKWLRSDGRMIAMTITAIFVIIGILPLSSCSSKKIDSEHYIRKIEEEIGLDIPDHSSIEYEEDYGWFGDGEAFAKIVFPAGSETDLNGMLQSNGLWKRLPVPTMLSLRIFGGEYDGKHYSYGNDNMKPAGKVKDGIYYFRDRAGSREAGKPFLDRSSYNYTFAVYDNKKNILYFFKYDS